MTATSVKLTGTSAPYASGSFSCKLDGPTKLTVSSDANSKIYYQVVPSGTPCTVTDPLADLASPWTVVPATPLSLTSTVTGSYVNTNHKVLCIAVQCNKLTVPSDVGTRSECGADVVVNAAAV